MFDNNTHRRKFITGTTAAMVTGLAGCTGGQDGSGGGTTPQTTTEMQLETFQNEAGVEVGANFEAIRELAGREGEITVYIPTEPELFRDVTIAGYNNAEEYPELDFEIITGDDSAITTRWINEYQADNVYCDTMKQAPDSYQIEEMGQNLKVNTDLVPNLERLTDRFEGIDDYVPVAMQVSSLFYNTNMVEPGAVSDWWTLVEDDRWFGEQLGFDPSPSEPKFVGLIEYLGDGDFMDVKDSVGREWLHKLKSQNPMWVDSHSGLARQCAAGQFPVCFTYTDNLGRNPEYPVSLFHMPKFADTSGWYVNNKSPHPNAALAFMNWMISEEGQEIKADQDITITGSMKRIPPELIPEEELYPAPFSVEKVQAFQELWDDVMGELSRY